MHLLKACLFIHFLYTIFRCTPELGNYQSCSFHIALLFLFSYISMENHGVGTGLTSGNQCFLPIYLYELSFWIIFSAFPMKTLKMPWPFFFFFPSRLTKIEQNFLIYSPDKQLPECVKHLQAQSEKLKSGKRTGWNKTFESRPSSHTVSCVLFQRNEHLQSPESFAGTSKQVLLNLLNSNSLILRENLLVQTSLETLFCMQRGEGKACLEV